MKSWLQFQVLSTDEIVISMLNMNHECKISMAKMMEIMSNDIHVKTFSFYFHMFFSCPSNSKKSSLTVIPIAVICSRTTLLQKL